MGKCIWRTWALAGSAALTSSGALAIPPDIRLDELQHTRWTVADGAPVFAQGMAQSADGALWIGSESGLFRFDGVQFQRIQAPEPGARPFGDISALMATPDGSLWVGLRYGGVYHWEAGRFTAHGEAQGLPSERTITGFARSADGRVWAGTSDGLFVLQNAQGPWRRTGAALGHPDGRFLDLTVDRGGTLWTSGTDGTFRLAPGAERFVPEPRAASAGLLAGTSDGGIWYTPFPGPGHRGATGLFSLGATTAQRPAAGVRYPADQFASRILGDRDGGLWAYYDNGLLRLPVAAEVRTLHAGGKQLPERAQRFGAAQGLSGDLVNFLFEDRDGNIWVSTDRGLDRFRTPRLALVEDPNNAGLLKARNGALLICNSGGGSRTAQGRIPQLAAAGHDCEAVDEDATGRSWWALDARVWWWDGERAGELPLPDAALPVLAIPALKADGDGGLWVSFARQGLFRHHGGHWARIDAAGAGLPGNRPVALGRDAAGRVWLGYVSGEVAQPGRERFKVWTPEQGLRVGNVQILQAWGDAMLVGGSEGLALIQGDKLVMLQGAGGERFEGVTGLVTDDGNAHLWIHAFHGIYRLAADELKRAAGEPTHALQLDRIDHTDGLRGRAPPTWPRHSAALAPDGRLWFSTTSATFALDPRTLRRETPPPALTLHALRVEGEPAPLTDGQVLPVGTRRIEVGFGAVNIARPERVRYRYRLEGLDAAWQYTPSRSAAYTNLPPGPYSFHVAAASDDGPWSEPGAVLRFSIPPAYHQTAWFYALCAVAAAAVLWLLHRWRLRQVEARVRLQTQARVDERERIARELHDTLLQSTQGLLLSVQAVTERTPTDHPDRARLEQVLEQADQTLREGRRRVLDLRADEASLDLVGWLSDMAAELSERGPASVVLRTEGAPRTLPADVHEQVLQIAREALSNAQKHAQAQRIEVGVGYAVDAFRLRITDDGIGMAPALMDGRETRKGHWGLAGMRERAALLGARLEVSAGGARGSVVELTVPWPAGDANGRRRPLRDSALGDAGAYRAS